MRANTVTMIGNVVVSKGPNMLKGDLLTVNMTSGDSAMICTKDWANAVGTRSSLTR